MLNQPGTVENQFEPSKIMQINCWILLDQFKNFKKIKKIARL